MLRVMDETFGNRMRNLALFCALLVVIIHCTSTFKVENPWLWKAGYCGFCRIAVPFFFFASGLFLGLRVGEAGWWKASVLKRCRTLLVPYFFWLTAFFAYRTGLLWMAGESVDLSGPALMTAFGFNLLEYPCLHPLWYVRALFGFILISPLIVWILKRAGAIPVFLLLPLGSALFFPLGLAFGMRIVKIQVRPRLAMAMLVVGGALMTGWILSPAPEAGGVWLANVALPFLVVGLLNLFPAVKLPTAVASTAFPIYLLHMFFVSAAGFLVRGHGLSGRFSSPVVLIGAAVAIFFSTMACAMALRRVWPRADVVLWGGR